MYHESKLILERTRQNHSTSSHFPAVSGICGKFPRHCVWNQQERIEEADKLPKSANAPKDHQNQRWTFISSCPHVSFHNLIDHDLPHLNQN